MFIISNPCKVRHAVSNEKKPIPVLFMVAKLARTLNIDAEDALRLANRKFRQRFQLVEHLARQYGKSYEDYSA
jgi:uncharacterized protein YabN with tetrapyrrole methylase and pyrophosphatase domain